MSNPRKATKQKGKLILKNGKTFEGYIFGSHKSVAGEVVFNTGMVGYSKFISGSFCRREFRCRNKFGMTLFFLSP